MNRIGMNYEELEAMRLLDLLKAGEGVPFEMVNWALRVTGDLIGAPYFKAVSHLSKVSNLWRD